MHGKPVESLPNRGKSSVKKSLSLFALGSRVKAVEMNPLGERIFGMQLIAMDRRHDQIPDDHSERSDVTGTHACHLAEGDQKIEEPVLSRQST